MAMGEDLDFTPPPLYPGIVTGSGRKVGGIKPFVFPKDPFCRESGDDGFSYSCRGLGEVGRPFQFSTLPKAFCLLSESLGQPGVKEILGQSLRSSWGS